jgi:hypothetical protein
MKRSDRLYREEMTFFSEKPNNEVMVGRKEALDLPLVLKPALYFHAP